METTTFRRNDSVELDTFSSIVQWRVVTVTEQIDFVNQFNNKEVSSQEFKSPIMKIEQITNPISSLPDDDLQEWANNLQYAVNNLGQFEPITEAELAKIKEDLEKVYFEMWKRAFQPVVAELKIRLAQLKK
ncbi:uncharacterized protein LOC125505823 [Dendroctonus ponderosae]|uniref:uncharacterized protein LOC125505823 n=1 Tax=Dendroctonus ponderosae TaxID=77166 RepID=UPI00203551F2|nr:uncharacterized protein LOC125505823 [Dendroctonus ponderosae]